MIRDGMVAVLISPGFGAGWSTWGENEDFMLFDPSLVEAAERGADENGVSEILKSFGMEPYTGGWRNIEICWIPVGTPFYVHEYDGSESIRMQNDDDWHIA
jgi:hypothetical protein